MSKQMWRYAAFENNTKATEEFCEKHNLSIQYLNRGYQLRINGVIDIYPVRKKWHYLKTGERGEFDNINDMDLSIFEENTTVYLTTKPLSQAVITHTDSVKPRKWWQIWR